MIAHPAWRRAAVGSALGGKGLVGHHRHGHDELASKLKCHAGSSTVWGAGTRNTCAAALGTASVKDKTVVKQPTKWPTVYEMSFVKTVIY